MENLMLQSIWVPALGGIICIILVQLRGKGAEFFMDVVRRIISLLVSGYVLYAGVMLFLNPGARVNLGLLKLGTLTTPIIIHAKPLSALMVSFVGLFGLLHIIYSWRYRHGCPHNSWYYGLSLLTLASANAVFLAADMFTLYIAWEISTLCLFGLIALGDNEMTRQAAGKTLATLGFADTGMLFFVIYVWLTHGTLAMESLKLGIPTGFGLILYIALAMSAVAKAGAIPMHSWVPTASLGAPTAVMGFLPSSIDKLLGIYLLFIATTQIFALSYTIKIILMIIGVISIIAAVFMAMLQHDLRRLLSYHAISQVGYMVLGIGTGSVVGMLGGLLHMINNAIYKNSLFLCAGAVEKQTGITELSRLGGLAKKMPLLFFANIVAALAISGVPPFNGFVSKWLVYQGCIAAGMPIMFVLAFFGSALTLASFIKVLHSVYFGPLPDELNNVKAPDFWLTLPPFVLSLICIFFGLAPGFPLGKLLAPATGLTGGTMKLFSVSFGDSLWQPMFAFGLMVLGLVIAIIYYAAGRAFKTRKDAAYVGGVRPGTIGGYEVFTYEKLRVPGTGFYNNIKEIPVFKAVLPDAERGVFDPYSYISKIGYAIIVKPLRLLHNGILSTYLSWAIIGLVIIGLVLIRSY